MNLRTLKINKMAKKSKSKKPPVLDKLAQKSAEPSSEKNGTGVGGKKRGPKGIEVKLTRLLVTDRSRKTLKKIAAFEDKTMIVAFEEIVEKHWNDMINQQN